LNRDHTHGAVAEDHRCAHPALGRLSFEVDTEARTGAFEIRGINRGRRDDNRCSVSPAPWAGVRDSLRMQRSISTRKVDLGAIGARKGDVELSVGRIRLIP